MKAKLTDPELLLLLEEGKSLSSIARKAGITRQAVTERLARLRQNLAAPAARRADETVSLSLAAMERLQENLSLLVELRAACVALLQGEDGIDLGPHDYDCVVTRQPEDGPAVRTPLVQLLRGMPDTTKVEAKFADPRRVLLSTLSQINQTLDLGVRLTERIVSAQELADFQKDVLEAIREADPETAARLKGNILARRELRLALTPPE